MQQQLMNSFNHLTEEPESKLSIYGTTQTLKSNHHALTTWRNVNSEHINTGCNVTYVLPWETRKPSCRWQTRTTRKHAKNCSNSTCLQCCRWQYWSIFIQL